MSFPLLYLASQAFDDDDSLFFQSRPASSRQYQYQQPVKKSNNNNNKTNNNSSNKNSNNNKTATESHLLSSIASAAMARTDIQESATEYVFTIDVPGIAKEDIDINFKDHIIHITGHRKRPEVQTPHESESTSDQENDENTEKTKESKESKESKDVKENKIKNKYIRSEIYYGEFTRSFSFPEEIDEDNVSAKCEHGVLVVHVPKKPLVKKEDEIKHIRVL